MAEQQLAAQHEELTQTHAAIEEHRNSPPSSSSTNPLDNFISGISVISLSEPEPEGAAVVAAQAAAVTKLGLAMAAAVMVPPAPLPLPTRRREESPDPAEAGQWCLGTPISQHAAAGPLLFRDQLMVTSDAVAAGLVGPVYENQRRRLGGGPEFAAEFLFFTDPAAWTAGASP